jgi:hypothetical protein
MFQCGLRRLPDGGRLGQEPALQANFCNCICKGFVEISTVLYIESLMYQFMEQQAGDFPGLALQHAVQ